MYPWYMGHYTLPQHKKVDLPCCLIISPTVRRSVGVLILEPSSLWLQVEQKSWNIFCPGKDMNQIFCRQSVKLLTQVASKISCMAYETNIKKVLWNNGWKGKDFTSDRISSAPQKVKSSRLAYSQALTQTSGLVKF